MCVKEGTWEGGWGARRNTQAPRGADLVNCSGFGGSQVSEQRLHAGDHTTFLPSLRENSISLIDADKAENSQIVIGISVPLKSATPSG